MRRTRAREQCLAAIPPAWISAARTTEEELMSAPQPRRSVPGGLRPFPPRGPTTAPRTRASGDSSAPTHAPAHCKHGRRHRRGHPPPLMPRAILRTFQSVKCAASLIAMTIVERNSRKGGPSAHNACGLAVRTFVGVSTVIAKAPRSPAGALRRHELSDCIAGMESTSGAGGYRGNRSLDCMAVEPRWRKASLHCSGHRTRSTPASSRGRHSGAAVAQPRTRRTHFELS